MKKCNHCWCHLPRTEFTARPAMKDGLCGECKFCRALAAARRRLRDPEQARAANRRWYWTNLDQAREIGRSKYWENPEQRREDTARWRRENTDKVRECGRKWHKENPDRSRAYSNARRAAKMNATPAWADGGDVAQWYEVACVLSRGGVKFHVDHLVPLRGKTVCGLHVAGNLTVIPALVNYAKGNRHWPDMP